MTLLWIYIWVLVLLLIAYGAFSHHRKKTTHALIKQIDNMIYMFDKEIYLHKDQIYDFDTTKQILYHNQSAFFKKWRKYPDFTLQAIWDIEYLHWLLQKEILPTSGATIIKATYLTRQKINTLKEYTHIILIILTLWVAKLFLP
jgi:hypothetical protein